MSDMEIAATDTRYGNRGYFLKCTEDGLQTPYVGLTGCLPKGYKLITESGCGCGNNSLT